MSQFLPEGSRDLEAEVKAHYEAFPYPLLETGNEGGTAPAAMPSDLLAINHYIYAGRRDFSKPFRVLVAGGGTGIATVRLAQQLSRVGCPSKLVYLDLSEESRRIAEQRARTYNLDNIKFYSGSLLNMSKLNLGVFDYIDCGGVLHHLEEPVIGLESLTDILAPDGGIGLMLYAPYGRAGIYPIQNMMRLLGEGGQAQRLPLLKKILAALPATHLLQHHERFRRGYGDNDAELVDLFLNPVDRSFDVPQLAEFCRSAGLRIVRLLPAEKYEPSIYAKEQEVLRRASTMHPMDRAALAELLAGNIYKHFFFAVHSNNDRETCIEVERSNLAEYVPVLRDMDGAELALRLCGNNTFAHNLEGTTVVAELNDEMRRLIAQIDGKRSLREIYFKLATDKEDMNWTRFRGTYLDVHRILHDLLYGLFLKR
tara:strand:+ start:1177 stop:2451 length:1275 start_codon:yes stop_codon:yes gene_type:complete